MNVISERYDANGHGSQLYLSKFHFVRWQARRDGDRSTRAGLIPSRAHQERMILRERSQIGKRADTGMLMQAYSALSSALNKNIY